MCPSTSSTRPPSFPLFSCFILVGFQVLLSPSERAFSSVPGAVNDTPLPSTPPLDSQLRILRCAPLLLAETPPQHQSTRAPPLLLPPRFAADHATATHGTPIPVGFHFGTPRPPPSCPSSVLPLPVRLPLCCLLPSSSPSLCCSVCILFETMTVGPHVIGSQSFLSFSLGLTCKWAIGVIICCFAYCKSTQHLSLYSSFF